MAAPSSVHKSDVLWRDDAIETAGAERAMGFLESQSCWAFTEREAKVWIFWVTGICGEPGKTYPGKGRKSLKGVLTEEEKYSTLKPAKVPHINPPIERITRFEPS